MLTLGDHQYLNGTLAGFRSSYHPAWGRFKGRTRPAVGNHDYGTPGAAGYFDYFNGIGTRSGPAGPPSRGYYSFNLERWHLVALNSNCDLLSCAAGSTQALTPAVSSPAELAQFAESLEHPVYWAGPIEGTEIEVTRTDDGRVFVRYLSNGAPVGDPRPEFLTVGTYPGPDPAGAIAAAADQSGAIVRESSNGQRVVSNEQQPSSVYFANSAAGVQVEVYDPSPSRAMDLARSGQIVALP